MMKISDRTWMLIRRIVLYPTYFIACFVTFSYCTFPYDRVRDRIELEVERAIPGSDLEIVSLSPSWVSGVSAQGVSLTLPGESPEERATSVSLTEVYARASVFSYLGGTTHVSFSAELGGGGTIEGEYSDSEDRTHIVAHLDAIALGRIGPLRRYARLPVAGTLAGEIDLTIAEEIADTQGQITLTIEDLAVGDGRARLAVPGMGSGVTVERLVAGDLNLRIQVERGVGRIQQLSASSEDVEIHGAGTVRFLRPIHMSGIDVLLRFDVKQPYRERNDRTRAIFTMVDIAPDVRPYRTPEGAFQIRLAGSFGSSIRAQGAGTAAMPR